MERLMAEKYIYYKFYENTQKAISFQEAVRVLLKAHDIDKGE